MASLGHYGARTAQRALGDGCVVGVNSILFKNVLSLRLQKLTDPLSGQGTTSPRLSKAPTPGVQLPAPLLPRPGFLQQLGDIRAHRVPVWEPFCTVTSVAEGGCGSRNFGAS